jgi:hypothetical protein
MLWPVHAREIPGQRDHRSFFISDTRQTGHELNGWGDTVHDYPRGVERRGRLADLLNKDYGCEWTTTAQQAPGPRTTSSR